MRKAQAWSLDAIVGVFFFILIILGVVTFSISRGHVEEVEGLKTEGGKIYDWFADEDSGEIIEDKKIDQEKLEEITSLDYDTLKNNIGANNDFCIYFVDDEGNVVYLNETDPTSIGIGSSKVLVNGIPCR